jgi:hypothetical protein
MYRELFLMQVKTSVITSITMRRSRLDVKYMDKWLAFEKLLGL